MMEGLHSVLKLLLTVIGIVSTSLGQDPVETWCPYEAPVEAGSDVVIACNITGAPDFIFWFRGPFIPHTNDVPILSSQSGQVGGSELGNGRFDLTEGGSLIINDTTLEDESLYTLRVLSSDGVDLLTTTNLTIFIRPPVPCPVVDGCGLNCTACHLEVGERGSLTCGVNGTRPEVIIGWTTSDPATIQFVNNRYISVKTNSTRSSSNTLEYMMSGCGSVAVVRCEARSSYFLLRDVWREVILRTAPCPSDMPGIDRESRPTQAGTSSDAGPPAWIVLLIVVGSVSLLAVIVSVIFLTRRGLCRNKASLPVLTDEMDANMHTILDQLIIEYSDLCYHPPDDRQSTSDEQGRVAYISCQCNIKRRGRKPEVTKSDELFTNRFLEKHKRVLFTAKKGYGKGTRWSP